MTRYKITLTTESDYALTSSEQAQIEDVLSDWGYENIEIKQTEIEVA